MRVSHTLWSTWICEQLRWSACGSHSKASEGVTGIISPTSPRRSGGVTGGGKEGLLPFFLLLDNLQIPLPRRYSIPCEMQIFFAHFRWDFPLFPQLFWPKAEDLVPILLSGPHRGIISSNTTIQSCFIQSSVHLHLKPLWILPLPDRSVWLGTGGTVHDHHRVGWAPKGERKIAQKWPANMPSTESFRSESVLGKLREPTKSRKSQGFVYNVLPTWKCSRRSKNEY